MKAIDNNDTATIQRMIKQDSIDVNANISMERIYYNM